MIFTKLNVLVNFMGLLKRKKLILNVDSIIPWAGIAD